MKKIIQVSIILIICVILLVKTPLLFVVSQYIYSSPCDQPILYRVDFVDSRFQISQNDFLTDIQQATSIWDHAEEKTLFKYDSQQDSLSINLIYDGRQSLNNQINNLENQLQNEKSTLDPQMSQYQNLSEDFKIRIKALNDQISYWNSQGGASPDEYAKLISEQQNLKDEANKLNIMAKNLNVTTDQYNAQVGQLNQTVGTYNTALQLRPEEGIYDPKNNRINIYFNISHNELVHTLAHELGHSLGLEHNQNPLSIMYPKTDQALTPSADDLAALGKICQKKTILDRIGNLMNMIWHNNSV